MIARGSFHPIAVREAFDVVAVHVLRQVQKLCNARRVIAGRFDAQLARVEPLPGQAYDDELSKIIDELITEREEFLAQADRAIDDLLEKLAELASYREAA